VRVKKMLDIAVGKSSMRRGVTRGAGERTAAVAAARPAL
jgi:hypothetical protein